MCDSCDLLVTCIRDDEGFHKLPQETCAPDRTCLGARCTSERNPICEEQLPFPCNDIGVFPDPFDCQIFHFCVPEDGGLKNYSMRCEGSFAYHAGSTFCQTRLENNVCFEYINQFPVDLCLYSGQTASLIQNPSIYYVCAQFSSDNPILYPFLFVCPHGGAYYNYECVLYFKRNLKMLMERF